MRKLFISALGLILSISAEAQFKVDADVRTRGEVRNGYITPAIENSTAASFVSQRSRIGFSFTKNKMELKLGIQDVRVWGQDDIYTPTGVFGDSGSLSTSEAWLKYYFTDSLSVKLGRQVFAYDSQRLLSGRDWAQAGLFYDAALVSYLKGNWQYDLGLSFNNTAENQYGIDYYTDKNRMQTMNFLYAKNKISNKMDISAIAISAGYQDATDPNEINLMYTMGINYNIKHGKLKTHLEGYYQTGKNNTDMDVDAYFLTASTNFDLSKKLALGIAYDYFSGEDASNTDADYKATDHTFDIMYGARYKYNGSMNQFMMMGKPNDKGGLQDINASLTYKAAKKHAIKTVFHSFLLANNYASSTSTAGNFEALDSNLGWEIDASYSYKIQKDAKLAIGASYYNSTDELYELKGLNADKMGTNLFGWVSLQFTPELFNSSK